MSTSFKWYMKEKIDALLGLKQDILKSGENIKTINGKDITGMGDVYITGGPVDDIRAEGATVITGRIANVTRSKLGLENVDNTHDVDKPISTATQTALNTEKTERVGGDANLQTQINATNVEVAKKVDKVSSAWQVYATSNTGAQTTVPYSAAKSSNSLARRDNAGRIRVGDPTLTEHAATKKYVDDADNAITGNLNTHVGDKNNPHEVTKAQVGLGNVDNTADAYKPISNAQEAEFNLRVKYSDIVDDCTSSASNKVLSAKQGKKLQDQITELEARGKFLSNWDCTLGLPETDPPSMPYTYNSGDYYIVSVIGTTNYRPFGTVYNGSASVTVETNPVNVNDTYSFDGSVWTLRHSVDPSVTFSSITGSARSNSSLASEFSATDDHMADTDNPHSVTKAQVGLGNCDNTSDLNKPISTATQNALDDKVTKATGSANTVYGRNGGAEANIAYAETNTESTLAKRGTDGVLKVGTPVADTDATTKEYVDDLTGVDDSTIERADKKLRVKDGGITLVKLADQSADDKDKVYSINENGKTVITTPKNHVDVTTFTGLTGDKNSLYYLSADYTESGVTYKKGLYIYNGASFIAVSPYLPLAGGQLTGSLKVTSTDSAIVGTDDTSYMRLCGGTDYEKGANLMLRGASNSSEAGYFKLSATDGSQTKMLIGAPDGTLQWDGKDVAVGPVLLYDSDEYQNATRQGLFDKLDANEIKFFTHVYFGADDTPVPSYTHFEYNVEVYKASNPVYGYVKATYEKAIFISYIENGTIKAWTKILTESELDDKYLPLAGGTMTGDIGYNKGDAGRFLIKCLNTNEDSAVKVWGASDWKKGAFFELYGENAVENEQSRSGWFVIGAPDSSTGKLLIGKPDGTLTWTGSRVLTLSYADDRYLPLAGGTLVGTLKVASGESSVTNSVDNSRIQISGGTSSSAGASLMLAGKSDTGSYGSGSFKLTANNGTTSAYLYGNASGNLYWNGNALITQTAADSRYLKLAGGTMTGAINMGSKRITSLADPIANADAVNKSYADALITTYTTGTPSIASSTKIEDSNSKYYKFGKLVVVSINAKLKSGVGSQTSLFTGLPAAAGTTYGLIGHGDNSTRIYIEGSIIYTSGDAASNWQNGQLCYFSKT